MMRSDITEWIGKDYQDRIKKDPMACRMMNILIENGIIRENLFSGHSNREKTISTIRFLMDKGILGRMKLPEEDTLLNRDFYSERIEEMNPDVSKRIVLFLTPSCFQPSWRAALGETPGFRSHRFPEEILSLQRVDSRRSLFCVLARGQFLQEWRNGEWEEQIGFSAQKCKIWITEDGKEFGALRIELPSTADLRKRWVIMDPEEGRNPAWEQKLQEWIENRKNEEPVQVIRT